MLRMIACPCACEVSSSVKTIHLVSACYKCPSTISRVLPTTSQTEPSSSLSPHRLDYFYVRTPCLNQNHMCIQTPRRKYSFPRDQGIQVFKVWRRDTEHAQLIPGRMTLSSLVLRNDCGFIWGYRRPLFFWSEVCFTNLPTIASISQRVMPFSSKTQIFSCIYPAIIVPSVFAVVLSLCY